MQTGLVYIAQGQRIRSAPSKGADMPARRWIYSTNKSAHHGGFSGGLHLLGHTCAHRHVQQRYINTHMSCPKSKCKSVTSHHTQLWISTHVHSWKHYIMNSASLIPGWSRSPGFGLHRNEGWWEEGWIKFANLRWDQRQSGRREWSCRSNCVCAATDMHPAAWERSQEDTQCFYFMLLTRQSMDLCINPLSTNSSFSSPQESKLLPETTSPTKIFSIYPESI